MTKKNDEKSKNAKKSVKKSEKTQKKQQKTQKNRKNGGKGIFWFLGVSVMAVALLFVCQFFFENTISSQATFYSGTKINGLDVGGMTSAEAENLILTDMLDSASEIEIVLKHEDESWTLSGSDFEIVNKIQPKILQMVKFGREGNFFQNKKKEQEIQENGIEFTISYTNIFGNMDERLEEIVSQIECELQPASLVFEPDSEEIFQVDEGHAAVFVDREKLKNEIDEALKFSKHAEIDVPFFVIENDVDVEEMLSSVALRGSFSTNYSSSSSARKNNIEKSISAFNGLVVGPGETISFNEMTGERSEKTGYKPAHVIVGGVYVDGVGGGVCQSSTTLYNALLRSGIDILTVNHHSIPASYVPLSFDSMVSTGYADLVFQNNLDTPIYIKTSADGENVTVEIYGQKLEDGESYQTEAELVRVLPHNGDRIVADEKGRYSDKILYQGEFYRVKFPREGYESKGYLLKIENGEVVEKTEIRHDIYSSQDGIVMEGVEVPAEGMTIPASDVKIISPQKNVEASEEIVRNRLRKTNPSEFNP